MCVSVAVVIAAMQEELPQVVAKLAQEHEGSYVLVVAPCRYQQMYKLFAAGVAHPACCWRRWHMCVAAVVKVLLDVGMSQVW